MQKDNENFCWPMISCKAMTNILYKNSEKSSLKCEKIASRNMFRHFFRPNFFMSVLFISNHTVFSFNLKLIYTCEFFKSFLKNLLVQINSKLNSKPYDYLYEYHFAPLKEKSLCRESIYMLTEKIPPDHYHVSNHLLDKILPFQLSLI